jgi:hypothetical protein
MDPKPLTYEDFSDRVGQSFTVLGLGEIALDLTLEEAQPLPERMRGPGARPGFSLVFVGHPDLLLGQQIHRLEHPELGELEIFLTPVGRNARAISYEAVFN